MCRQKKKKRKKVSCTGNSVPEILIRIMTMLPAKWPLLTRAQTAEVQPKKSKCYTGRVPNGAWWVFLKMCWLFFFSLIFLILLKGLQVFICTFFLSCFDYHCHYHRHCRSVSLSPSLWVIWFLPGSRANSLYAKSSHFTQTLTPTPTRLEPRINRQPQEESERTQSAPSVSV